MGKSMLAPHASVAGFAIFLVVYATQIWGGVFPFLPTDFQTQEVTLTFYLSQSLAFCASYVASAFGSYYVPSAARRMLVTLSISLTFIGSCFIIAVMYVPMFTLGFIVAGGAFLGVGCAGIFMLWQRYFSSISAPECNWRLIAGTAFGSLLYFMLYVKLKLPLQPPERNSSIRNGFVFSGKLMVPRQNDLLIISRMQAAVTELTILLLRKRMYLH